MSVTGDSYEIDGVEIFHIWDAPHLLKNMRNNFLTKYLEYEDEDGTKKETEIWEVIRNAWYIDRILNPGNPRLSKITQEHIEKGKIPKMRVKYATQVLSNTMANWIEDIAKNQRE